MCRLLHKRRKGLCLTPKQQFRLMRQSPFLLCLCQRGVFTAFQIIFLFRCSFEPEAESRVWPLAHKWNKPSPTAGKPGRMILSARPDTSGRIKPYFLAGGLPGFTLPAMSFFCWGLPFFTDFSFEVSCIICLYFRLPPFSRLSVSRIRQSFPFWAQR